MVRGPASSAKNGDPGPPPGLLIPPPPALGPPPPQLSHRPATDAHWALSSLPFAQPPLHRACARRWENHVDATLDREEWTEQEGRTLVNLVEAYLATLDEEDDPTVKKTIPWSKIAKLLSGTPVWSKCPLRAQSSGGAFASQQQPVRPPARRSRGSPLAAQGHPEHPLGLRRRLDAGEYRERLVGCALAPA